MKYNEIIFKVGTRVRILRDYHCGEALRKLELTVQYHTPGDAIVLDAPFIDNCLYTDAGQFVGQFGNWEIVAIGGVE